MFDEPFARDPSQPGPDRHQRAGSRRWALEPFREVALKRAQVLVAQAVDGQRVRVGGKETEELADLGAVSAHGVRASVGFQLKPAEVFVCCGLKGEWHGEAVAHDNGREWGLSGL